MFPAPGAFRPLTVVVGAAVADDPGEAAVADGVADAEVAWAASVGVAVDAGDVAAAFVAAWGAGAACTAAVTAPTAKRTGTAASATGYLGRRRPREARSLACRGGMSATFPIQRFFCALVGGGQDIISDHE